MKWHVTAFNSRGKEIAHQMAFSAAAAVAIAMEWRLQDHIVHVRPAIQHNRQQLEDQALRMARK